MRFICFSFLSILIITACQSSENSTQPNLKQQADTIRLAAVATEPIEADFFPEITPRNIEGDSLKFADYKADKMIIIAFWSSKIRSATDDIPFLLKYESQLKKKGVQLVYISWDKVHENWAEKSPKLGLKQNNYILNVTDKNLLLQMYQVQDLPRYIWINAKNRATINAEGTEPFREAFMADIEKTLKDL